MLKLNSLWLLLLLFSIPAMGQTNYIGYFEPSLKISYPISSSYKHNFSIGNRNVVQEDNSIKYKTKYIEFSHLSEYEWASGYAAGIGVKYRLRNTFNGKKESELRFQEQFVYTYKDSGFQTTHRFRIEQRIYASLTKHRWRYQLGYKIPLNNQDFPPYIKAATESLLEIAKNQKPEFEQRLNVNFGWWINSKTSLQIGAEYQLADYVQDLYHELFFLAELGIKL